MINVEKLWIDNQTFLLKTTYNYLTQKTEINNFKNKSDLFLKIESFKK